MYLAIVFMLFSKLGISKKYRSAYLKAWPKRLLSVKLSDERTQRLLKIR